MSATVGDVNPKTLENAKRQFVELYGSALVMNTYLKLAFLLVSLLAVGLLVLNYRSQAAAAELKPHREQVQSVPMAGIGQLLPVGLGKLFGESIDVFTILEGGRWSPRFWSGALPRKRRVAEVSHGHGAWPRRACTQRRKT